MDVVDESWQARPVPRLRPYVATYLGYRQAGIAPAVHRGLPSPYLTFIVTLVDPLVILRHPDPAAPGGRFDTLLGGLHSTAALIAHDGCQSGVQIALRPPGCRALFGLPAGALASLDVEATDVAGALVGELRDRIRGAASWPARFAAVDSVLGAAIRDVVIAPELTRAWRALTVEDRSVSAVAAEVGWSARRLSGRFGAEFGLSPKSAARVARFDRVRHAVQRSGADLRLADLAAEYGYYDQAHLARDFRDLAGIAASGWLTELRRFVQADGPAVLKGSLA